MTPRHPGVAARVQIGKGQGRRH